MEKSSARSSAGMTAEEQDFIMSVYRKITENTESGRNSWRGCFRQDEKGVLWFKSRLVIPKDQDLKKKILDEAHLSKFSMHLGSTKMYHDLKLLYWWTRMKREIAQYVSECDTCQRIKASHLKLAGALQPLSIPSWKWDDISMDFIMGLPNTSRH